jgi:hypothetical protein
VRRLLKKLVFIGVWATGLLVVAYSIAYLKFNDEVLGSFISDRVNKVERGSFNLRSAHFDYFGGLASILFNTPARAVGQDYELYDPDGNLVIKVPYVETDVHIQELVTSLARFAATRNFTLNLHFSNGHIPKVIAVIAPTRSTWGGKNEVNLVAAMSPRVPSKPSTGGELRISVDEAVIDDAHFAIGFPNTEGQVSWYGKFSEASARASLVYSSRDDLKTDKGPYFFFKIEPLNSPVAELRMGGFQFPVENLKVAEFGPNGDKREDIAFKARARTLGADIAVDGALTNSYSDVPGVTMMLKFEHARQLLRKLPEPLDAWLSGDPDGKLMVAGPFKKVVMNGEVANAEGTLNGIRLANLSSTFDFDPSREPELELKPQARVAGGTVAAEVDVGLERLAWWRARLTLKHIDPERVDLAELPLALRKELAGRLDGTLRLGGSLAQKDVDTIYVQGIDADLERMKPGPLPKKVRLTGALDWAPTRVQLKEVKVAGEGLQVAASGNVDPRNGKLATTVRVDSARGSSWLGHFKGAKGIKVGEAHATGSLGGTIERPQLGGHVAAKDVTVQSRVIDAVEADVKLRSGTLALDGIKGQGLGGTFEGSAEIGLFSPSGRLELRRDPTLQAQLTGSGIDLERAVGWDGVTGKADLVLSAQGLLADPTGQLDVKLPHLALKGDAYENGRLQVALGGGGATIRALHVQRKRGGALSGSGRVGWDGTMDLQLKPKNFPLQAIPGISTLPVALAGTLSGDVNVGGDKDRPSIGGIISLFGFKVRDTLLGDGKLSMIPGTDAIAIKGNLFGKVSVDGYLTLFPKFTVVGTLKFVDIELERIFPEIRRLAEVQGRTSGSARITFDGQSGLTYAALTLDQLALTLSGTEEDGRARHLVVHNQDPVKLSTDGTMVKIDRAHLTSSLGAFSIQGQVGAKNNDVKLHGQIGLELLEYFFRGVFDHTHGDAFVDLTVKGDADRPDLQGVLDLKHAVLQPRGVEQKLTVPVGRVDFGADAVTLRNITLLMDDARASASGSIALTNWVPGAIRGEIHGELSMRMLQLKWLLGEYLADASGRLAIDVKLGGTWGEPRWAGSAEIKRATGKLRRWDHDLSIGSGTLSFINSDIVLGCPANAERGCKQIRGSIDEHPLNLDGTLTIGGADHLKAIDVRLDGSELRQETSEWAISFSPHVRFWGNGRRVTAAGSIDINDGRYLQSYFEPQDFIVRPRVAEKQEPFWSGIPLLETMGLDLDVQSTGPLLIRNNIADLTMQANLKVSGTLSEPHLAGAIRIDESGQLKFASITRIPFESTGGTITFEPDKKIPDDTPTLDIGGRGEFRDENDNVHNIELRLQNTLSRLRLVLSAPQDGWDQSTILAVLLTGRTPEQWRRVGQFDPATARVQSGASASEGVIKTGTGWAVGQVLADPIQRTFGLDQANIQFGTGSFDVTLCKRLGRMLKTCGFGEVGFTTSSRAEGRLELRLSDTFSTQGKVEYVTGRQDTSQDSLTRGRLELKLQIPLGY